LAYLKDAVEKAAERGYVFGLDGRKIYIRSAHSALNALLQGAGAVVMKQALVILDGKLKAQYLVPGKDYEFVLNIHDEFQIEVSESLAGLVAKEARQSIIEAGQVLNLRCPLDGEAKIGSNWAETH
jgi:DNA polymerase I-like protein with 3'-5' exonuclease and polymerase domains